MSYGFVKGRSVKTAVTRAKALRNNYPWAFKTDISSFFDQIDRTYLNSLVKRKIPFRSLHPLLQSAASTEVCNQAGVVAKLKKMGIIEGRGVRQGMPISPYFSNLVLSGLDKAAEEKGYRVVRYADDIIAFASSEKECREIESFCIEELSKIGDAGLSLSEPKTQIVPPSEGVSFLGMGLAWNGKEYSLQLTRKQLQAVKNKILTFSDIDYCLRRGVDIAGFLKRLEGVEAGYRGAYDLCENKDALDNTVRSAKNKALQDMLEKNFGVSYSSLTKKQKRFLNLD